MLGVMGFSEIILEIAKKLDSKVERVIGCDRIKDTDPAAPYNQRYGDSERFSLLSKQI